jgi:hypothetical protein
MSADLNPKLDFFLDFLVNVTEPKTDILVETPFPLDYFLPKIKKLFYRQINISLLFWCFQTLDILNFFQEQINISLISSEKISNFGQYVNKHYLLSHRKLRER